MKAVTLTALSLMLRPSDIAPKSAQIQQGNFVNTQFTADRVIFLPDGSAGVYLFGIKNDLHRDGFRVFMRPCSVQKVCPVSALATYMKRNGNNNPDPGRPVFTPLNYPFSNLSAASITNILNKAIQMAGLANQGFSAKSFRPTGETAAIEGGMDPDRVGSTDHWKSQECFETHYVHAKLPEDITDAIFLS